MTLRRKFYADILTGRMFFYQPACDETKMSHNGTMRVLAVPVALVDGFSSGGKYDPSALACADSVERYLSEIFLNKSEFKTRVRAYVESLMVATGGVKKDFTELQKLAVRILHDFKSWRFYGASGSDSGMLVLRFDREEGESGETALLHFWENGLVGCRDPRFKSYTVDQLKLVRKIGEGHPSEVFEAVVDDGKHGNRTVAAKRLKDWKITAGGSLSNELQWLLAFDHPNIIPFKGAVIAPYEAEAGDSDSKETDANSHSHTGLGAVLFLLTEFMELGRLSDLCKTPLEPCDVVRYSLDLANGLKALHECNVMHRDLHSDNILISHDRAVIADLGSAKVVVPNARHTESVIMYKYIKPPEVQEKSSDPSCLGALYGTPFDVWALCCMMIGMILGIPCIETRDHQKRSADLQAAGSRVPQLLPLMSAMLSEKAAARPSAAKVAQDLKKVLVRL